MLQTHFFTPNTYDWHMWIYNIAYLFRQVIHRIHFLHLNFEKKERRAPKVMPKYGRDGWLVNAKSTNYCGKFDLLNIINDELSHAKKFVGKF